jgi:hypothetical protein
MRDSGEMRTRTDATDASEPPATGTDGSVPAAGVAKPGLLGAVAQRALAEAEARRAAYEAQVAALPKELGGRGGKEPGRYGDWEVKGIATDF